MSLAGKVGRLGQVYVKEESSYGVHSALASTDAFRHLVMDFIFSPRNRVNSLEKKQSPGTVNRWTRRMTASWNMSSAYLYAAGVLNTPPESHIFMKNAFGSFTNVTQDSTVLDATSSPAEAAPTATQFAITDIGAWVTGDLVLVKIAGGANAGNYVRRITAIASAAGVAPKKLITVSPALPGAPALGDHVKGGITYKLTRAYNTSLFLAWYIGYLGSSAFSRGLTGADIEKLKVMFDALKEGEFSASGAAQAQQSSSSGPAGAVEAQPGGFTTVGAGNSVSSGIKGGFYYNASFYNVLKADFEVTTGRKVRNETLGKDRATEIYEAARRTVLVNVDARLEDPTQIYADAESTANSELLAQNGDTEGLIFAFNCPLVEWEVPNTPDGEEALTWAFKGVAKESADTKNDEVFFGAF